MQSVICSATPQLRPVRELLSIFFKVDLAGVLGNFAQPMQYREMCSCENAVIYGLLGVIFVQ